MGLTCSSTKNKSKSTNKNSEETYADKKDLSNKSSMVPCCTKSTISANEESEKPKNSRFSKDDNMFCCSICFEVYNDTDRFPGIFLCGHTFCMKCINQLNFVRGHYRCPFCKAISHMKPSKNYALLEIIVKQQLIIKIYNEQEIRYNPDHKKNQIAKKCVSDKDHLYKFSENEELKCHTCGVKKVCSYCIKCDDESLINCYHCISNLNNNNTTTTATTTIRPGLYNKNIFGCLCKKGKQNIQWIEDSIFKKCINCELNYFGYGVFGCLNCKFNLCYGCYHEHYEKNKHASNIPSPIKFNSAYHSLPWFSQCKSRKSNVVTFNNRNFDKAFTFSEKLKQEDIDRKTARNLIETNINYNNNIKNIDNQNIEEFYYDEINKLKKENQSYTQNVEEEVQKVEEEEEEEGEVDIDRTIIL
jgi:hypothetical protein